MVMINDLIDNFNRFSIKYKNSIWSLTPYTILLENIKTDLNLVIKNIKSSLNKMQRKTTIILDEPIKRKLFNIFTQTRITLKEQDLSLIKSLFNENQRKKLNKYIKLNKSINKTKNIIVHINT